MGEQPRRRGVQRWSRQGTLLRPLHARGDADQKFGAPRALWADQQGVLVADTLRGTLQQFAGDGRYVREWPCGYRGHSRPIAVARTADGSVLFADRGDQPGVFAFDRGGLKIERSELHEYCRDAVALAIDKQQRVYVLDHGGERVVRFTAALQWDQVMFDLAELQLDPPHAP
jgi:hypothetical protein